VRLKDANYTPLSAPFEVFRLDFAATLQLEMAKSKEDEVASPKAIVPTQCTLQVPVTSKGSFNTIAYWWDVNVDEEKSFSTAQDEKTNWQQMVHFVEPVAVKEGDKLAINASHDNRKIEFSVVSSQEKVSQTPEKHRPSISFYEYFGNCYSKKMEFYEKAVKQYLRNRKVISQPSFLTTETGGN
jgi:hypothetical protein